MLVELKEIENQRITESHQVNNPLEMLVLPEHLMLFREFCGEGSLFYPLFQNIFEMNIILDTNVIISDILWLATKRKNHGARPCLLQMLACGTLKAYSPKFLLEELDKHLPRLAIEREISLEVLNKCWDEYRPFIELVDVEAPTAEEIAQAQDPKDLPYIKLQQKIGAKIYSNDSDIAAMKGDVVSKSIIISLQQYSYHATVEYSIKWMGASSVIITQTAIEGISKLIGSLCMQAKKMPPWALSAGALLIIMAAIHPKSRSALLSWIRKFPSQQFTEGFVTLLELSITLAQKHYDAQEKARKILEDNSLEIISHAAASEG